MGMSIKINGFFPDKKQYIVMMNHTSFIDMFLYPLIMRGKWTGITSSENFKYPLLSIILKKMDAIPIKKTNKIGAIKTIQIAENKLEQSNVITGLSCFPGEDKTYDNLFDISSEYPDSFSDNSSIFFFTISKSSLTYSIISLKDDIILFLYLFF